MCKCGRNCSSSMACCFRNAKARISNTMRSQSDEMDSLQPKPSHPSNTPSIELPRFGYKVVSRISNPNEGVLVLSAIKQKSSPRDIFLIFGFIRDSCPFPLDRVCTQWMEKGIELFLMTDRVAIKQREKRLNRKGMHIQDGHKDVEDITKEAQLLRQFHKSHAPASIIGFVDFFQNKDHYFLVMEEAGQSLFQFTIDAHKLVISERLSLREWKRTTKYLFAVMVQTLEWMHSAPISAANLDVSLENIVMDKATRFDPISGTMKNLGIRFIDFGLTETFNPKKNPQFYCNKFVGKMGYASPRIYRKQRFSALKADVWALGICLFMMSVGAPPWQNPTIEDPGYRAFQRGNITKVLKGWNRLRYIGKMRLDLMTKMLSEEKQRLNMKQCREHEWLSSYFGSRSKTL